jgi:hypothetical protein
MEMRTGLSMDLLPGFERGELDLVIAGRGHGCSRTAACSIAISLIWVAAPGFELRLHRTVAIGHAAAHCTHRGHQPGGARPGRHPVGDRPM